MGSDPDDRGLFFINASKPFVDYRHISWFGCTIIRFHLACSIPPRTSHRPLLRTFTDEGPFPDIGSHVIQPVHPLFCCCNTGMTCPPSQFNAVVLFAWRRESFNLTFLETICAFWGITGWETIGLPFLKPVSWIFTIFRKSRIYTFFAAWQALFFPSTKSRCLVKSKVDGRLIGLTRNPIRSPPIPSFFGYPS